MQLNALSYDEAAAVPINLEGLTVDIAKASAAISVADDDGLDVHPFDLVTEEVAVIATADGDGAASSPRGEQKHDDDETVLHTVEADALGALNEDESDEIVEVDEADEEITEGSEELDTDVSEGSDHNDPDISDDSASAEGLAGADGDDKLAIAENANDAESLVKDFVKVQADIVYNSPTKLRKVRCVS